jgi:hypothetical protein
MNDHVSFFVIKSLDIGYITILYMLGAYMFALFNEYIFTNIYGEDHSKKTKNELLVEIMLQVSFSGICAYIGRNIMREIPSPLHGIGGFDHYQLKELNSGSVLFTIMLAFQKHLQKKIALFREML